MPPAISNGNPEAVGRRRIMNGMRAIACIFFLHLSIGLHAQVQPLSSYPKKGSYLYFHQPAFEDNSFLLDEAFTQPKGIIQNILNLYSEGLQNGDYSFAFTQELPITSKHQLSYTVNYFTLRGNAMDERSSGIGDIYVHYSVGLFGKNDWAMVVPQFALIIPAGKDRGYGGWGGQVSLAVTKRLSEKVITHYNLGYSYIAKADFISGLSSIDRVFFEEDLHLKNAGASVVWYVKRKFNLILEGTGAFTKKIHEQELTRVFDVTVNPGARFLIDRGRAQLVPGIGVPISFENARFVNAGLFLYLSFEPDYLNFFKSKSR